MRKTTSRLPAALAPPAVAAVPGDAGVGLVRICDAFGKPIWRLRVAASALAGLSAISIQSEVGQKDIEPVRSFIEDIENELQELQDAFSTLLSDNMGGGR